MKKIVLILLAMLLTASLAFGAWHIDVGFESGIPGDWTIIDGDGDASTWFDFNNASYARTGTHSAGVAGSGSGSHDWLITPQVTIQNGDSFTFYARSFSNTEDMDVMLSTNGGNTVGDFDVTLANVTGIGDTYTEFTYDLSSYTGQVRLAIHWIYADYAFCVDDVLVGQEAVPAPDPPVATAATTDGTLTFFANWNASTGATGYYLDVATDVGFTSFLSGYEDLDVGDVTTYSVTALSAVDHYYRLRAYNTGGTSSNSNVITVFGSTLPVELSTFTAQYVNNVPTLYWVTQSEIDNIGWYVYCNTEDDFTTANKISDLIEGHGTTSEPHSYIYEDNTLEVISGNVYWYWIESVDLGGEIHHFNSINVEIPDGSSQPPSATKPVIYSIQNSPNPFRGSTEIRFTLSESVLAEVTIYNILGAKVKTLPLVLASEDTEVSAYWDGKDESGEKVAHGIYFYTLEAGKSTYSGKMIHLR